MDRSLPTNYKWHVVAMLWCISFFNYADRQAIFSVFPLLEREMQLTSMQLGLLGSAFAWVYGLGAPFAGWIVDRVKRQERDPRRALRVERHLHRDDLLVGLQAPPVLAGRGGAGRDVLLSGLDVARERLPRQPDALARHGAAPDERLYRDDRRRVLCRPHRAVLRVAALVHRVRRARRPLGLALQRHLVEPPRGAADLAEAGGHGHAAAGRLRFGEFLRLVGRTPTLLCLMGAFMCANFVAVVLLSWMPKFLYDRFHMGLAMAGLTATVFVQLASMVGAPLGGWLADAWRRRSPRGRLAVQMVGVLGGAPFVALCGMTQSIAWLIVALTLWGLFKGLYDANIFASVFDVVRPEARGAAAGFMNTIGWLGGGGTAPLVIGLLAEDRGLGTAIALASTVYLAAGVLLLIGIVFFVTRDAARLQQELAARKN